MSGTASQPPAASPSDPTPTQSASVDLRSVYEPIANELASVESILKIELRSETPWVDQLLEHSWLLGGKRMRPAFCLLSAGYCGAIEQPALQLAAALEMVHTATLVHDDILDEAETRRHEPTANSKWGNKVSVLLGDYLFTHAFFVASQSGSAEAVKLLAASSNRVCEGEMRQNAWRGNFRLTETEYLQMVSDKTAELAACACHVGASLAGAAEEDAQQFRQFGLDIGIAFQIVDDVLDLIGEAAETGKTLGTDLLNKKPTLPVIHCLQTLTGNEREGFLRELENETPCVKSVLATLESTDSLSYARQVAQSHASKAAKFSQSLDGNVFSTSLRLIADFTLRRSH